MRNILAITALLATGAGDEPLSPKAALEWSPPGYPEAVLHARVPYLEPAREWERMDVWVPRTPERGKLPCVIALYGGGYGDKMRGFIRDARPLLSRGFVLAAPDYALQTDAPVPLCAWDVAQAIRFLRANSVRYRIDPERIGVWGWSAGGWIAQDLCYAGPRRLVQRPGRSGGKKIPRWLPLLEPRPPHAEQSLRVQAVVSDWGAGKLWDRRRKTARPWLSADDPPLLTCYNGDYSPDVINPVMLLRGVGVPSSAAYGVQGNTHVPKMATAVVTEEGEATTWGESILDFFERELKRPDTATAPEMIPHGGSIASPTAVRLLTAHPAGKVCYTLDGSSPDSSSRTYSSPVIVSPGQTLRAVALREGLRPSRITTGVFSDGPPSPEIVTRRTEYEAMVGEPFRVELRARNAGGASWSIGGKTGTTFREFEGQRFNPPRHVSWLTVDSGTGVLSGTPRAVGIYPVIVSCAAAPRAGSKEPLSGDALLIVVRVSAQLMEAPGFEGLAPGPLDRPGVAWEVQRVGRKVIRERLVAECVAGRGLARSGDSALRLSIPEDTVGFEFVTIGQRHRLRADREYEARVRVRWPDGPQRAPAQATATSGHASAILSFWVRHEDATGEFAGQDVWLFDRSWRELTFRFRATHPQRESLVYVSILPNQTARATGVLLDDFTLRELPARAVEARHRGELVVDGGFEGLEPGALGSWSFANIGGTRIRGSVVVDGTSSSFRIAMDRERTNYESAQLWQLVALERGVAYRVRCRMRWDDHREGRAAPIVNYGFYHEPTNTWYGPIDQTLATSADWQLHEFLHVPPHAGSWKLYVQLNGWGNFGEALEVSFDDFSCAATSSPRERESE